MKLVYTPDSQSDINLDESMVPAINIVFLLLIFFMVAGQIKATKADLTLPDSISDQAPSTVHLLIEITADGQYHLNNEASTSDISTLNALFAAHVVQIRLPERLTLKVHRDLPASTLDKILQLSRLSGLTHIEIQTTRS